MTSDAPLEGTVDRIVDGRVTILVEGEVHLDVDDVPGTLREGHVVHLRSEGGYSLAVDEGETADRRAAVDERMSRLRAERSRGRFDDGPDGGSDDAADR